MDINPVKNGESTENTVMIMSTRYCIVATVFKMDDLKKLLNKAKLQINETDDIKSGARQFHKIIHESGDKEGYIIKLRKPVK